MLFEPVLPVTRNHGRRYSERNKLSGEMTYALILYPTVRRRATVSRDFLQWLICKIPDKISHSITISMTVTPTSMTSPSRNVNFDRFMAPLPS